MQLPGFIGPAYTQQSVNVDAQRCVNLYPEVIESGRGKEGRVLYLAPTPGLLELTTVGSGPIRLIHEDSLGRIFVVSGNELYQLTESGGTWAATLCDSNGIDGGGSAFTFDTSSGPIKAASMSFNGDGSDSSTLYVDGTNNYLYLDNPGTDSLGDLNGFGYTRVTGATQIKWIDGYFIVNEANTNKFYVSDLKSFNLDTLNFSASEGDPDLVIALENNHRDLWVFNEYTTEIFVNTGNPDFPFERVQGGFLEVGCRAAGSVAKIAGTILWLGRTKQGEGMVYAASGMSPQRISTHAIEHAIAGYADPSSATAFCYEDRGHQFYVLNFSEATWVYDLSTGLWHERAYLNNGTLERHLAETHAFSRSKNVNIVGDVSSTEVYQFDKDTYSDDGDAIKRLRSSPHFSSDLKRVFYKSFQLDMETGIGLDGGVQGSNPTVMMDFSDDGGHTWSSESWTLADAGSGQIGEYKTRVIWRRLGRARDRIFRVQISDPVKVVLIGAHVDVQKGIS